MVLLPAHGRRRPDAPGADADVRQSPPERGGPPEALGCAGLPTPGEHGRPQRPRSVGVRGGVQRLAAEAGVVQPVGKPRTSGRKRTPQTTMTDANAPVIVVLGPCRDTGK